MLKLFFRSLLARSGCSPLVHFAGESGHVLHLEPIEGHDLQTGLGDELIDPPVQVTPAADDVLNGIQPVLPDCDFFVFTLAMP